MMREALTDLWLHGAVDGVRPWSQEEKVTFICPVPGYDRHHTLVGVVPASRWVPMHEDGPDAEEVARLAGSDPSVKGMGWCRPREPERRGGQSGGRGPGWRRWRRPPPTSRSSGTTPMRSTTSPGTGEERRHPHPGLGRGPPASADHVRLHLEDHLRRRGRRVPAASGENVAWYLRHLGKGSIGPDKLNHLRHVGSSTPQGCASHGATPRSSRQGRRGRTGAQRAPRPGSASRLWSQPSGGFA